MADPLLIAARTALNHLGLLTRPTSVDLYGTDLYRVTVNTGNGFVLVVIQGNAVNRTSPEVLPPRDTITADEHKAQLAAAEPQLREACKLPDIIDAAHRIETLVAALHPAVAATAIAVVKAVEDRDMTRCCFRRSDAAERGFQRAAGSTLPPIAAPDDRRANRERSLAREKERDELTKAIALEIGHGVLYELLRAMASFRIGAKNAKGKLAKKIEWARKFTSGRAPYLTNNPGDPSPNAIYPATRTGTYDTLKADHDLWLSQCRKEIAAAETLLATASTVAA